jgi:ComF family protein
VIGLLQRLGLSSEKCLSCGGFFSGSSQGFLCDRCLEAIKPHHPMDYSEKIEYVASYRVFGMYESVLREVLHGIKFGNSKSLALLLGRRIKEHLPDYLEEIKPDMITFPSLNIRRFWGRGFNHVEYILRGAEVPYMKVFRRRDISPPLARLNAEKRQKAVLGHMLRDEFIDFIEGKRVLLVDDLLTTGSTIKRLAYLLLSVGAEEVHAYFIAKG